MSAGGRRAANKEQPKETDTKTKKHESVPWLQWEVMSLPQVESALGQSLEELQTLLKDSLCLSHIHTCMKEAALLDYYTQAMCWCQDANLSPSQTSFTMGLLHTLLRNITEKNMALVDNVLEFAEVLAVACQCPPTEEELSPLLTPPDAQALITFIHHSVFQKYSLYQALMSSGREELLLGSQRTVEVLSSDVMTPLEEGVPSHLFPPTPSPDTDNTASDGTV